MSGTIIAAIVSIAIGVVGAWIVYRIFKEKGPSVGPFGSIEAVSKRKEHGMDVIEYKISLPVSPSTDVVKKILTVRRADTGGRMFEPVEAVELPNEQTEVWRKAVQDTRVDLELVAVDDSGNCSDPVCTSFTALDTIKPVLTGEMTVEAVGEVTAEPAEPEAPPAHVPPSGDSPFDAAASEQPPPAEGEDAAEEPPPPTSGTDVTNS